MIVVDDGSTDDTPAVVAHWQQQHAVHNSAQLHYCYQANGGPATARNRGVALANGSLLAFLDADDWWHPQKLQRQVDRLRQEPTLGLLLNFSKCHCLMLQYFIIYLIIQWM